MSIQTEKILFRKRIKGVVAQMDEVKRREEDRKIHHLLLTLLRGPWAQKHWPQPKGKGLLGGYAPLGDEPNCLPLLSHFPGHCCFPAPLPSQGEGKFQMGYFLTAPSALVNIEAFGSPCPTPDTQSCAKVVPQWVLVPGLAFSTRGERLGRGKGFFDRFLKDYPGLSIGICYEEQIFEKIPCEDHDVRLKLVVTPRGIYPRNLQSQLGEHYIKGAKE